MVFDDVVDSFLLQTWQLIRETNRCWVNNHIFNREERGHSGGDEISKHSETTNIELAIYSDVCLENHQRWQQGLVERLELVFGRNLAASEANLLAQPGTMMSRTEWAMVPCSREEKVSLLLKLLVVSIPEYGYDARICLVLDQLWRVMGLERSVFVREVEGQLAEQIASGCLFEQQNLQAQKTNSNQLKKSLMVGLGAMVGGVAVGITAGLAAPAIIPLFASLLGLSTGTAFLSGATGAALFGIVFGAGGAGLTGYRVGRRYRNISSFRFHPLVQRNQMRVAVGISGWITEDKELYRPWVSLALPGSDLFVLECEKDAFKNLGAAIGEFITNSAVGYATWQILKTTALSTALAALTWPITLLQSASLIDNRINNWAGLVLADAIKNRAHGHRPLTLAGFSLGALIIFECLLELCKDPSVNLGVVENVILFGLPARIVSVEKWCKIRMLIAGRFIHCYSKRDWVLRFLYRTTSLTIGDIAGLNPIENVDGIENVNMSNFVKGHLEYVDKIEEMLELFNL